MTQRFVLGDRLQFYDGSTPFTYTSTLHSISYNYKDMNIAGIGGGFDCSTHLNGLTVKSLGHMNDNYSFVNFRVGKCNWSDSAGFVCHSIRCYDRYLTDEENLFNYVIDKACFNLT